MKVLLTTLNAKYIHTNLAIRLLYELNREWPGLEWREFTINRIKMKSRSFVLIMRSLRSAVISGTSRKPWRWPEK